MGVAGGSPRRLTAWALAGLGLAAAALVLHAWTPPTDAGSAFCLSRRLFHLPCPGCGVTRALFLLAKGRWRAAIALHPFAPLLAAEAVALWLGWGALLARPTARAPRLPVEAAVLAHLAAFIALWLGRAATGTLPW
jgi:hypothetical protein